MVWPVTVSADLDTGAVVVTVVTGPALRTVVRVRTAVLDAKEQRPTGVGRGRRVLGVRDDAR